MKKCLLAVAFLCLCQLSAYATVRRVPAQFTTIQAAINAAANGDTILVAPGTYFENLRFKGKQVMLTSQYLYSGNPQHIRATVINGSQPAHPDTASVVRFTNGETHNTVLMGFTLTGGSGTKWPDAHIGGKYREGGGILCEGSSPTICYNLITGNKAVSMAGNVASAGGGGIRCDGGQPRILNNVIINNQGLYGAGIVLNFTGAIIRNNVICQNYGGEMFGGSGIWILKDGTFPKIIENNTIIGNRSESPGGGIRIEQATAELRNNLIWGNTAPSFEQIRLQTAGILNATYNAVEKGFSGTGNISMLPMVADSGYFFLATSPGIDAGDPATGFNDPAQTGNPAMAAYPSLGALRNDIGAYGGPQRSLFPYFSIPGLSTGNPTVFAPKPTGTSTTQYLQVRGVGAAPLTIDSVKMKIGINFSAATVAAINGILKPLRPDSVAVTWNPQAAGLTLDTLLIYHNDPTQPSPKKLGFRGVARLGIAEDLDENTYWLRNLGANPVKDKTALQYQLPKNAVVNLAVYNLLGQQVKLLWQEDQKPGIYQAEFNTKNLANGTYLVRLSVSGNGFQACRMLKLVVNR